MLGSTVAILFLLNFVLFFIFAAQVRQTLCTGACSQTARKDQSISSQGIPTLGVAAPSGHINILHTYTNVRVHIPT
jgi:hypothetical protein